MKQLVKYVLMFLKWTAFSLAVGAIGGLLGSAFHYTLHGVTHLRGEHPWLIFLLPTGGILTVCLYKLSGLTGNRGINEIIEALLERKNVRPVIAPVIFIASAITHLFGGSSGREGAAFQLGGSAASAFANLFKLKAEKKTVIIMCGMAATFAGLFGTPLTAALFTLEFASVGTFFSPAVFPCYLSSFVAAKLSHLLGVHAETAVIGNIELDAIGFAKFTLIAVGISLVGILTCYAFHGFEHLAKKVFSNNFYRILAGSVIIILATLAVGDQRYSGAGMDMALNAVAGNSEPFDFALKMLFTAVTLAAGFKGGEIVPVFCIGATFGCTAGALLGLDPGICAALGLVGLFCCVTNSPIASIVLSIEMFGGANLHIFALLCMICFVLSGHTGLYSSQFNKHHKVALSEFKKPNVEH
ncbi:MAG: chloride channel protein [Ruminococcaceae bacterium]|nr:chloride channel protein [Oscillospiraceae bacterium]